MNRAEQAIADYCGRDFKADILPSQRKVILNRDLCRVTECPGLWFDINDDGEIVLGVWIEKLDMEFDYEPIPTADRSSIDIEEDLEEAIGWLCQRAEREWNTFEAHRELGRYYHDERI